MVISKDENKALTFVTLKFIIPDAFTNVAEQNIPSFLELP
jgi:hypothetical protein